jgi:hypothetical protein
MATAGCAAEAAAVSFAIIIPATAPLSDVLVYGMVMMVEYRRLTLAE